MANNDIWRQLEAKKQMEGMKRKQNVVEEANKLALAPTTLVPALQVGALTLSEARAQNLNYGTPRLLSWLQRDVAWVFTVTIGCDQDTFGEIDGRFRCHAARNGCWNMAGGDKMWVKVNRGAVHAHNEICASIAGDPWSGCFCQLPRLSHKRDIGFTNPGSMIGPRSLCQDGQWW